MESRKNSKEEPEIVIDEYVPRDRPAFLDDVYPERVDVDLDIIEVFKGQFIGVLYRKIQLYNTDPIPQLKNEIISFEYVPDSCLQYLLTFAAVHGDIHDFDILVKNYRQSKVTNAGCINAACMKAACKHDRHDVFDHFIRLGVIPTSDDLNVSTGSVRQTLLKMGLSDIGSFWDACMNGNENEFHQLILNGADINATPWFSGQTPLAIALGRCIANNISPQDDVIVTTLRSLGAFSSDPIKSS